MLEEEEEANNSESVNSLSDNDEESISSGDTTNTDLTHLPIFKDYPLFHHHRLDIHNDAIKNRAVHKLLKSNGGDTIFFHQMSHHKGALIRIPSASSSTGYAKTLKKKKNFMNEVLKFMGACLNESSSNNTAGKSDVARCILQYLFENFEEDFKAVANNNNDSVMESEKKWKLVKLKLCYTRRKSASLIHVFSSAISTNTLGSHCLHPKKFEIIVFPVMSSNQQPECMSYQIKQKYITGINYHMRCLGIMHALYFLMTIYVMFQVLISLWAEITGKVNL
jgi:hypothetical protein